MAFLEAVSFWHRDLMKYVGSKITALDGQAYYLYSLRLTKSVMWRIFGASEPVA